VLQWHGHNYRRLGLLVKSVKIQSNTLTLKSDRNPYTNPNPNPTHPTDPTNPTEPYKP